jgi:hypothetical protein
MDNDKAETKNNAEPAKTQFTFLKAVVLFWLSSVFLMCLWAVYQYEGWPMAVVFLTFAGLCFLFRKSLWKLLRLLFSRIVLPLLLLALAVGACIWLYVWLNEGGWQIITFILVLAAIIGMLFFFRKQVCCLIANRTKEILLLGIFIVLLAIYSELHSGIIVRTKDSEPIMVENKALDKLGDSVIDNKVRVYPANY